MNIKPYNINKMCDFEITHFYKELENCVNENLINDKRLNKSINYWLSSFTPEEKRIFRKKIYKCLRKQNHEDLFNYNKMADIIIKAILKINKKRIINFAEQIEKGRVVVDDPNFTYWTA